MSAGLRRGIAALLLALMAALGSTPVADAQESCTSFGESVIVREGETLDCDLKVVNGHLEIEPGGIVDGNVIVMFGGARIDGRVRGNVNAWEDSVISGRVDGDVYSVQDLELTDTARIGGSVASLGEVDVAAGAEVAEVRSARELRPDPRAVSSGARARDVLESVLMAAGLIGLAALFGALATAAAPHAVLNLRSAAGSSFGGVMAAFGLGGLALFLALLAFPILTFITFGVGGVLLILLCGVAMAMGSVGIGQKLGARLLPGRDAKAQAALGTGVIATLLSALLYGPNLYLVCGGLLLASMYAAWATGASLLSRLGSRGPLDRPPPQSGDYPDVPSMPWLDEEPASAGQGGSRATAAVGSPAGAPLEGGHATEAAPVVDRGRAEDRGFGQEGEGARQVAGSSDSGGTLPAATVGMAPAEKDSVEGPETTAASPPTAVSMAPPAQASRSTASEADPGEVLEQVAGLTPIYAALLREGGIDSLSALRSSDPATLVQLVSAPGILPITVATAEGWVAGAAELIGE